MDNSTLPDRDPYRGFMAFFQGSFVGVFIRRDCFLRLKPVERYILDGPSLDQFLTDAGDYCRTYGRAEWSTVCELLHRAEFDRFAAVFDAWCQFDPSPMMPTELRLPQPLAGPHQVADFAGEEFRGDRQSAGMQFYRRRDVSADRKGGENVL